MKILTEYRDEKIPATMKAEPLYDLYTKQINYTIKDFKPGEAVGIYLTTFDSRTKELIEELLAEYTIKRVIEKDGKRKQIERHYTPHNITLKYKDDQYKLSALDDWKESYEDPENPKRVKYIKHPMLAVFESEIQKRKEQYENKKLKDQYNIIFENYKLPDENEIDSFLQDMAPLYEVDVDYSDNLSRYRAYIQIKYYLEHDFEYSRPANAAFIMPIGNETYLEDLIYKEGKVSV